MYSSDTEIHDQAYQFFKQEAPEFLQTIETGLLSLREDRSTANVHAIMRAAHSIKGGAASLNFEGIKTIAHQLEDVFRSLYRFEGEIDQDVEGLLLQAYDCLRLPLMDQLQLGHYEAESAIAAAEPVFEVLKLYLGNTDEEVELPTAAELGVDIVQIVFEGDVQQGILRLQNVLANPEGVPVKGEIRAQIEVFNGIGELLNLSGFKAIAQATLQALEHNPEHPVLVGKVAVANFEAARAAVLAGDRTQGGQPSRELITLAQSDLDHAESIIFSENLNGDLSENLNLHLSENLNEDANDPEHWFQSLEQQIDDISFIGLDGQPEFLSKLNFEDVDGQPTLFPEMDIEDFGETSSFEDLNDISSELSFEPPEEPHEFENFDALDLDQIDQNFDIFIPHLDASENEPLNANTVEHFDDEQTLEDLQDFFNQKESVLAEPKQVKPANPAPSAQKPAKPVVSPQKSAMPVPPQKSTANIAIPQNTINSQRNAAPYISETIRVDLPRLDRLNNVSSELVTQENASHLQNQQLHSKIARIQKQFKNFELLSKNLQNWLDKTQRKQVTTQEIHTSSQPQTSIDLLADFDPLQMDSYNRLHGFIQEALEDIAQMDEGMRDMAMLMQQTQQTQRRKQQILKQLRYDLLWARMLPLGDILSSLPRMVREMSNKYNKQVNLKLLGTGTLVDKSILEKLYDPFVHLVRNAFDHGTEPTQKRIDLGKPLIATIEIRAYYRGNQTYIEVKDDGQGINPANIKAKAIEAGLLDFEKANLISNEETYQFLFAPSFSTADTVSELSGRGMGLATVYEQVRSLKGSIDIKSEVGQGTTFTIKLPLTLSIAKLLIFSIEDRLLSIPIDTLLGIVIIDPDEIQIIQGREFYRFEDRLIPLYPVSIFADGYPLPKKSLDIFNTETFTDENQITLLLFSDDVEIVALPIDRVLNEQELAIKPFGKAIAPPPYLYGCTVLGDGTLVPVIDSSALLDILTPAKASVALLPLTSEQTLEPPALKARPNVLQRKTILIVDDSLTARQSLDLTLTKFGYQVIQANDGRDAIDQLGRHAEIQAVLCDVEMPNMNGFEFLAACHKDSRYQNMPIIMLTSRSGSKHRGVAQMLGASGYLTKPYLEQELIKTIQRLTVEKPLDAPLEKTV
ncbi:hybrid sensor histidine kinase/response regulator [Pseudanabaena sp. 'Roaring Creek']|uniref:hybrid sensor histidine kinase/response regulator n=1 Tax=Pseudanabaena sp. 'Roaring Creek' TaxID=1681830 RepID=UPI0006D82951|nr:hybrid sensor histidine kinase/response regulator [Pseudanabaena sp. 'Roaring Creek']